MKKQFTIDVPPYVTEDIVKQLIHVYCKDKAVKKTDAPPDDPLKRKITIELPIGVTEKQARDAIRDVAFKIKIQPFLAKYVEALNKSDDATAPDEPPRRRWFGGYQPTRSKEGTKPPSTKENGELFFIDGELFWYRVQKNKEIEFPPEVGERTVDAIVARINNIADRVGDLERKQVGDKVAQIEKEIQAILSMLHKYEDDLR